MTNSNRHKFMKKLKDFTSMFNRGKEGVATFIAGVTIYSVIVFVAGLISSLIEKTPFDWKAYLRVIAVMAAVVSVFYALTRLLAFRTKLFPKTGNREGLHGVSFIFLLLVSFILFVLFA